jgi:hypothetical protein
MSGPLAPYVRLVNGGTLGASDARRRRHARVICGVEEPEAVSRKSLEEAVKVVLGVALTPTLVRMALVDGDKADGVIVEHDVFDITAINGGATSSACAEVIAAILGTREGAAAGGHQLVSTGVTCSDRAAEAALRDALCVRGVEDVIVFSELHAAGALAQAIGRAVGYGTTALMFVECDTATLSVVQTIDGSTVTVLTRSLHGADAMAVFTEMATTLETRVPRPDGMFLVGSRVDVSAVKSHLEQHVSIPVHAPDQPELALARGAALAAANAPRIDASTAALAYSHDPEDATTAGAAHPVGPHGDPGQLTAVGHAAASLDVPADVAPGADETQEGRKPFLLAGSSLTAIFVVGMVALVVSLAVSIQPTTDQRPTPGENAMNPNTSASPPPAVRTAQPADPGPAPQIIPAPEPSAAPPLTALQQAAPEVTAQEVAPAPTVLPEVPAPVAPPAVPPAPVIQLPLPWLPPILQPPRYDRPAVTPPWYPIPQQPQPKWRKPGHGHD